MNFISKNPRIYIFAGKARSGKDTCANIVKEYYEQKNLKVVNLQYSSYLKEYAKKIENWSGDDETKPRQLLIDLGTDLIRGQIDKYFFIKRIVDDIKVYSYFFDVITISDARVSEELDIPKEKFTNVKLIGVTRPYHENGLTAEQKNSLTETGLNNYDKYDYVITKDSDIDDLKIKVLLMLEEMSK